MTQTISFFVDATPKPGGSKRAFFNKATGRAIVVDDCKGNRAWRDSVIAAFIEKYGMQKLPVFGQDVPVIFEVIFYLPRPKHHYGKKGLKASAPQWCTKKPDALKLTRSTEDALTHYAWHDDAQVASLNVAKCYAHENRVGALITITEAV
jgi:Holliday junction resolvase RusA-like endonuclease